jgi:hypothetical protein
MVFSLAPPRSKIMTKYSITETWNNLTPLGRLFLGIISLSLIACTTFSCFSTVVIMLLPVPPPTVQSLPTFAVSPTFTISPSPSIPPDFTPLPSPSLTSLPTGLIYASSTPPIYLITPTNTFLPFPLPTVTSTPTRIPRNKSVCSCRIDKYNCEYFKKQIQAQACFNFCFMLGAGDIHHLDEDHDGVACNNGFKLP